MKVLIALSCLLAYASAGFVGLSHTAYSYPHLSYAGPQHLPVIGPNGVPIDEPAVQARRAEHAAAHVEAAARNGDAVVVGAPIASPLVYAAGHGIWAGPQHLPVIGANGVPVDTAEVQIARANHAAAHIDAKVRNGDASIFTSYTSPVLSHHVATPIVAHPNGAVVPADTIEVAAAKAAHYAAHVEAKARNGLLPLVHYRKRRGVFAYSSPILATTHYAGPQHLPVIGANGVPVDEPAVQIARANHAAAVVDAHVRNGDGAVIAHGAPLAYAAPLAAHGVYYAGPQHLPVIGANGVPVDTADVQVARAAHAAHHIEAKVRNGDAALVAAPLAYTSHVAPAVAHHVAPVVAHHVATPFVAHSNGAVVPADSIEVAAAKSAHFAAHVEAKARNGIFHAY